MEQSKTCLDWVNVVLGVVLVMWSRTPTGAVLWSAAIGGVAISLVAIWALAAPGTAAPEWVNALLGLCAVCSPSVLRFSGTANGTVCTLVGIGVVVAALCIAGIALRRERSRAAGRHLDAKASSRMRPQGAVGAS